MTRSSWELRHIFPSYEYLRFVRDYLVQFDVKNGLFDPFAIELQPGNHISFIRRNLVELEVSQSGTRIVTGKLGSGKTTLLRILLEAGAVSQPTIIPESRDGDSSSELHQQDDLSLLLPQKRLMVSLQLAEIRPPVPEDEIDQGKSSLLTTTQLIRNIFNAYWKEIFQNDANRLLIYPQLRLSRWWTERLHWFYHQYKPYTPVIPGQFELTAWLESPPNIQLFSQDTPAVEILRELVNFVLSCGPHTDGYLGNAPQPPFQGIQIFVDDLEILSTKALKRLIRDAQTLYEYRMYSLWFTLFADQGITEKLIDLDSVAQGKVGFYRLPLWTHHQLRQLINRRLGFSDEMDVDIGSYIPDDHLEYPARKKLVTLVTNRAIDIAKAENSMTDAPVHLLRLLRGVLSVIADHESLKNTPAITLAEVQEIVNNYTEE